MGAFFRRYLALATKEFQQLRRNPGLIVQLMIPPTIVLVIFGYALNPKVRNLRLGVVDQSFTAESRDLIDALTENVNFDVTRVYTRPQDAEDALKNLNLDLFLVIPHDFALEAAGLGPAVILIPGPSRISGISATARAVIAQP